MLNPQWLDIQKLPIWKNPSDGDWIKLQLVNVFRIPSGLLLSDLSQKKTLRAFTDTNMSRFRIEEELCQLGNTKYWDTFHTTLNGEGIFVFDRFYCDCGHQHDFREKRRGRGFYGYLPEELEGFSFVCEQCEINYLIKNGTTYSQVVVEVYIPPEGAVLVG